MANDEKGDVRQSRRELLTRFDIVSRLSYEDKDFLAEWLDEPMDDDHAQYMVNRSDLEILERLQTDGPLGLIYMVQTLRTFVTAQRHCQRLLEEAQTKLTRTRAIIGEHVNNPSEDEDRVGILGMAYEILQVLERPDDPWDVDADA